MIRIAEFFAGIVGGFAIYYVACFLLDNWISGTAVSDNILKSAIPVAIAAGTVISVLWHVFSAGGTEGRK